MIHTSSTGKRSSLKSTENIGFPFGIGCTGVYRFSFNGKEDDSETYVERNEYDYGMRIYNPRLGRFLSVDPLSPKYPMLTPYQFASNTPIWAIDLDGLEAYLATETKGTGHTFLVVKTSKELIVYTYGRFGAVDLNPSTGEGVLIRLTGADAADYINTELTQMGAKFYKVGDVSPNKVKAVVDSKYIAGQSSSEEGVEGKVVDDYNLFSSNCTTKSSDWLKESGTQIFQENGYEESFVIPSSLQEYLGMENIDDSKNLTYANAEMYELIKTFKPKPEMQGAGIMGNASGSSGNSSGGSANSSGSGSSTGANGVGSSVGSSSAGSGSYSSKTKKR